ncbi:MAG TPA: 16S rRNA (cytosine(1402)-N(4))-methyltransferase, partial [Dehalococcoidia bacterium]|nr:16S rRNA (cytosine(1402)-N(4))-methyltransferase [Dehalococcoidia bacterium]
MTTQPSSAPHTSVMVPEVLDYLNVQPGGRYIDCTVGGGGHSAAILEASGPDGRVLGIDADPQALTIAEGRLAPYQGRFALHQSYFDHVAEIAAETTEMVPADGLLC